MSKSQLLPSLPAAATALTTPHQARRGSAQGSAPSADVLEHPLGH